MRRSILMVNVLATALWSTPRIGPTEKGARAAVRHRHHVGRPADRRLQFRREARHDLFLARGWLEQEGQHTHVIADATEALKLKPDVAIYDLRGSAYCDKREYDIATADFNDALRTGSPQGGIVYHNRGNAWRAKGDYARAIADYDASIKFDPKAVFSYQNRGVSSRRSAISMVREAIRLDPALASPLTNRAAIWRAKGDIGRTM